MAEQGEPGSAMHLPHDPLGSRVDALGAAVVVRDLDDALRAFADRLEQDG